MKIYELFEQTVGTVPPGAGSPLPTTQPTIGSANTATSTTPTPQVLATIKNSLFNMKDPLRAAGGGSDLNFNKIAQAMTDPKLAVNPSYMSAISKMLPGLADVLKNTQAAGLLKAGVKTGVTADQLRQQQQQQQQQQKSR